MHPAARLTVALAVFTLAPTASAITREEAVGRAQEWVDAGLGYCQVPYGGCDSHVCCHAPYRAENPAWDAYRTDCSGLVSWAWGLPPPGRVTSQFAPHETDITFVINAADLQPGDALNKWDQHIVLFDKWVSPGVAQITEEYNWPHPAHTVTTSVSINGPYITRNDWGETFMAIRYVGIQDSCTPHCEGNVMIGKDCGKGDCGAYGSQCADDALGLRCVEPFCPPIGDATVCIPGTQTLAHCHDGNAPNPTDCAKSGGVCSTKNGGPHCDQPPKGYIDGASCDTITGWAQDPDAPDQALDLHLAFAAPEGDPAAVVEPLTANVHRDDLCNAIKSCNHGFVVRTPRSLLDGKPHPIHAVAFDVSGGPNAELGASPKTVQCETTAPKSPAVLRRIVDAMSFAAWKLSPFYDVAPLPEGLARVDTGALGALGDDLPSDPLVVACSDGSPSLWVIDGGSRRKLVDETSRAAWRLSQTEKWSAAKLDSVPRGPDFPALPLVVRAEGPTFYVLDVPNQHSAPASSVSTSHPHITLGGGSPAPSVTPTSMPATATPSDTESGASCAISAPSGRAGGVGGLFALAAVAGALVARRRRVRDTARMAAATLAALAASACSAAAAPASDDPPATTPMVATGCNDGKAGQSGAGGCGGAMQAATPPPPAAPTSGSTQWAKRLDGAGDRQASAATVDAKGNAYVVGTFAGTIDLGGGPLASEGSWTGPDADQAIFVAMLGADGKYSWGKRFSGPGSASPQGIAVDATGDVVLVGSFVGTVDFDTIQLTSAGGMDAFVAKLDPTGKVLWAHAYGDAGDQIANAVAVDAKGNIALTGAFEGTIDVGQKLASAGASDVLVLSLDPSGKPRWSARFGDGASQMGFAIAIDKQGDVVVTGGFDGKMEIGADALTSAGGLDVFVAKLAPDGKPIWASRHGAAGDQIARSVALDASGNIALTGEFSGALDFGAVTGKSAAGAGGSAGAGGGPTGASGAKASGGGAGTGAAGAGGKGPSVTTELKSVGGTDVFLASLDPTGATLFAKSWGDLDDQRGLAVTFDAKGNLFVTGDAPGAIDFGGGSLGDGHVFVASVDAKGAHRWSKRYGPGAGEGCWVAAGAQEIVVAGFFSGTLDLGAGAMDESSHIGAFLARLTPLAHPHSGHGPVHGAHP